MVRRLARALPTPQQWKEVDLRVPHPIPTAFYQPLLDGLRWQEIGTVWDPTAVYGRTVEALDRVSKPVISTCPVLHYHRACPPIDYLDPAVVQRLPYWVLPADAVVAAMPDAWCDVSLPVLLDLAERMVCLCVTPNYVTEACDARLSQIQDLYEAGRLALVTVVNGRGVIQCLWLVAFASRDDKSELWLPPHSNIVYTLP
jgi:hypothetical protein